MLSDVWIWVGDPQCIGASGFGFVLVRASALSFFCLSFFCWSVFPSFVGLKLTFWNFLVCL